MHDWFSKTGQGAGSEYRYNFGPGSNGNIRGNFLNEHETTYVQSDGSTQPLPASQSYELHGGANQTLPGNLHARGRVDYFSSIVVMQSVQMDYTNAYQNQRSYGGNVVGAWRNYSLNATVDHTDYFSSSTASSTSGSWPRVALTRNERLIPDTPLYFSVGGEYASMLEARRRHRVPDSSYNRTSTASISRRRSGFPSRDGSGSRSTRRRPGATRIYSRSLSADDPSQPSIPQT